MNDTESGNRTIDPFQDNRNISTYCDQETEDGGWTIILNRDASQVHEEFQRSYTDYEHGFGDRNGEFWLGLQTIHQLTTFPCTELRIDMEKYDGTHYVAKYSTFTVGSQADGYVLNVQGFSSTPSFVDEFDIRGNGMKFTTKDKDQDRNLEKNCATTFGGGWWYEFCHRVKLTGQHNETRAKGIHWLSITTYNVSFKRASMKLRRKTNC